MFRVVNVADCYRVVVMSTGDKNFRSVKGWIDNNGIHSRYEIMELDVMIARFTEDEWKEFTVQYFMGNE